MCRFAKNGIVPIDLYTLVNVLRSLKIVGNHWKPAGIGQWSRHRHRDRCDGHCYDIVCFNLQAQNEKLQGKHSVKALELQVIPGNQRTVYYAVDARDADIVAVVMDTLLGEMNMQKLWDSASVQAWN